MLPKPEPIKLDPGILDWAQEVTDVYAVKLALLTLFYPGVGEDRTLSLSARGRIPGIFIMKHLEKIREATGGFVITDDDE
ncbi:MAG: hypothetical protein KKA41_17855 [Proteobacteria bacterium]|nr:hypothetical protein [Pseudomonadota bacterium]